MFSVNYFEVPAETHRLWQSQGRWFCLHSCGVLYRPTPIELKRQWALHPELSVVGTGADGLWIRAAPNRLELLALESGEVMRVVELPLAANEGFRIEGHWLIRSRDPEAGRSAFQLTNMNTGETSACERTLESFGQYVYGGVLLAIEDGAPRKLTVLDTSLRARWEVERPSPSPQAGPWLVGEVVVNVRGRGVSSAVEGRSLETGALLWSHNDQQLLHAYITEDRRCLVALTDRLVVRDAISGTKLAEVAHDPKRGEMIAIGDRHHVGVFSKDGNVTLLAAHDLRVVGAVQLPAELMPNLLFPHNTFALTPGRWAAMLSRRDSTALGSVLAVFSFDSPGSGCTMAQRARSVVHRLERHGAVVYQIEFANAEPDEIMRCAPLEVIELARRIGVEPRGVGLEVDRAHEGSIQVSYGRALSNDDRARIFHCLATAERRLKGLRIRPGADGAAQFKVTFECAE